MKEGKLVAIVPVRAGSQRVKNKNIRDFAESNLLTIKIETFKRVLPSQDIIVNSDCEKMLKIAEDLGVSAVRREEYYASSECNNSEFFKHIAEVTECEYIMYSPVTSPLVSKETYVSCINKFLNSNIENLVTVSDVKHHMWLDGRPLNYDPKNAPNSQDLPDIVSVNYGICLISKKQMMRCRNVVSENPSFHLLNEIESIDIDTEFDFMVAEIIYNKLRGV